MKLKRKIILFIVYFTIFFTSASLIDYYAYLTINPKYIILASLILSLISLYIHNRYYKKSKADELAKKLEEIL